jgi:hypothetical protein
MPALFSRVDALTQCRKATGRAVPRNEASSRRLHRHVAASQQVAARCRVDACCHVSAQRRRIAVFLRTTASFRAAAPSQHCAAARSATPRCRGSAPPRRRAAAPLRCRGPALPRRRTAAWPRRIAVSKRFRTTKRHEAILTERQHVIGDEAHKREHFTLAKELPGLCFVGGRRLLKTMEGSDLRETAAKPLFKNQYL